MSKPKKSSKQERADKRRESAIRKKIWKRIGWISGIIVVLGGIFSFAYINQKDLPGQEVVVMEDQSHIAEVTSPHIPYNSDPPTSGPHVEYIAQWGVHKESVPKEVLVHNLEDGGVVIYYNSQATKETVEKLEQIVKRYPQHVVVNPYPEMKSPITLTAWGRMDQLQELDEKRITDFIETFQGIDHH